VRVVQRLADLTDDVDGALRRHPPLTRLLFGVAAIDILHGNPELAVRGLPAGIDGDDVGVIQRRRQIGLA
jgi:hypothetical protein